MPSAQGGVVVLFLSSLSQSEVVVGSLFGIMRIG